MDTRRKILDWNQAKARLQDQLTTGEVPTVVTGYFDPLLAPHAEDLSRVAGEQRVWVIVHDPPEPILPLRARAELVAALRMVEHVIPGDEAVVAEARQLVGEDRVVASETTHLRYREQFARRVLERHIPGTRDQR